MDVGGWTNVEGWKDGGGCRVVSSCSRVVLGIIFSFVFNGGPLNSLVEAGAVDAGTASGVACWVVSSGRGEEARRRISDNKSCATDAVRDGQMSCGASARETSIAVV